MKAIDQRLLVAYQKYVADETRQLGDNSEVVFIPPDDIEEIEDDDGVEYKRKRVILRKGKRRRLPQTGTTTNPNETGKAMSIDADLYSFRTTLGSYADDEVSDWLSKHGHQKLAYVIETDNAPQSVKDQLTLIGEEIDDNYILVVVND